MGRSHMLEQSQSIWCSSECGVPMESFSLCGQLGRHTNEVDTRFFCFDVLIWNYIAYRLPADAPADGVPVSFQSKREGPKPWDEQQMQIVSEVKLTQFMPANTTVDLGNIIHQIIWSNNLRWNMVKLFPGLSCVIDVVFPRAIVSGLWCDQDMVPELWWRFTCDTYRKLNRVSLSVDTRF